MEDTVLNHIVIEEAWISFDTTKRLVESIRTDMEELISNKTTFQYNGLGFISLKSYFEKIKDRSFIFSGSVQYLYNELDLLLKIITSDENNTPVSITEYKYEFLN